MRLLVASQRRRGTGFTLIELLVVISIIALLISLLLPALGSARRSARTMKSQSNIRSIGQSFHLYASDNENLFPAPHRDEGGGWQAAEPWSRSILPYIDGGGEIWVDDGGSTSPTRENWRNEVFESPFHQGQFSGTSPTQILSYAFNKSHPSQMDWVNEDNQANTDFNPDAIVPHDKGESWPTSGNQIPLLLTDMRSYKGGSDSTPKGRFGVYDTMKWYRFNASRRDDEGPLTANAHNRSREGWHRDGHVEIYQKEQLIGDPGNSLERNIKWNFVTGSTRGG